MEKTPNRSGMFQNVSDIIREPGQEGIKMAVSSGLSEHSGIYRYQRVGRHAVRQEIRGFSGKPLRPGRMRPGWHPVKHGGILP